MKGFRFRHSFLLNIATVLVVTSVTLVFSELSTNDELNDGTCSESSGVNSCEEGDTNIESVEDFIAAWNAISRKAEDEMIAYKETSKDEVAGEVKSYERMSDEEFIDQSVKYLKEVGIDPDIAKIAAYARLEKIKEEEQEETIEEEEEEFQASSVSAMSTEMGSKHFTKKC